MKTGRNIALTSLAGNLRARGADEAEILDQILAAPERERLPEAECRAIARSIGAKPAGKAIAPPKGGWLSPLNEHAERRGLSVTALQTLGCRSGNYFGKPVVVYLMRDADGQETGVRMRHSDGSPFKTGNKSHTPKGQKLGLICPWPFPSDGAVLVCEGEIDAAAALSAGWDAVIGTPGARPGRACLEALQTILAGRQVILAPDGDGDGHIWREQIGAALMHAKCQVRYIPPLPGMDLEKRLRRDSQ